MLISYRSTANTNKRVNGTGKNSAYERIQRTSEIDNLGDMVSTYGYGFFNVEKKN